MTTHRPCTLAVHAGNHADPATGAVAPPIHLATTFRHGPAGERIAGYEYQREGNPTNDRLREALVALEGGATALTFASGMAAMTTLLESLPAGSRVLFPDDCYSGLRMLFSEFLPERGLVVETVDMADLDAVRTACTTPLALLWIETPSNPLLKVCDITALAAIAHDAGRALDHGIVGVRWLTREQLAALGPRLRSPLACSASRSVLSAGVALRAARFASYTVRSAFAAGAGETSASDATRSGYVVAYSIASKPPQE